MLQSSPEHVKSPVLRSVPPDDDFESVPQLKSFAPTSDLVAASGAQDEDYSTQMIGGDQADDSQVTDLAQKKGGISGSSDWHVVASQKPKQQMSVKTVRSSNVSESGQKTLKSVKQSEPISHAVVEPF